jgi:hypothetical protein
MLLPLLQYRLAMKFFTPITPVAGRKVTGSNLLKCPCLSHRELRLKRHQYVNQHRNEFPAIYQPGVE